MATPKSAEKPRRTGLVLSLGGAPPTPHDVTGLDGTFSTEEPRPLHDVKFATNEDGRELADRVGGYPGEALNRSQAERLIKEVGVPLALADLAEVDGKVGQ